MEKKFNMELGKKKEKSTRQIILEYFDCILDYKNQGYTIKSIWENLTKQGIINTSYVMFSKNLKEIKEEKRIINE